MERRCFPRFPPLLSANGTQNPRKRGSEFGIETARLAGILAAKRTSDLIPLCHPLAIDYVDVDIRDNSNGLAIEATVRSHGRTGVEMEALTAVSVAALTIYDMVKAADKTMVIENIRLMRKLGGKSGLYERDASQSRT